MSGPIDPFQERLSAAQDAQLRQRDLEPAVRERLLAGQRPTRMRSSSSSGLRWAVGAGSVVAAAAAVALMLGPDPVLSAQYGGQELTAGAWIDADQAAATIEFSDGTVVQLEQGSTARLAAIDERGARIVLERGVADLDVVPRNEGEWAVQAGPFTVDVTGTAFRAEWSPDGEVFRVSMRHGSVFVTGPHLDQGQRVTGSGELEVDLVERRGQLTLAAPEPQAAPEVEAVQPGAGAPKPPQAPAGEAEPEPDWHAAVIARDPALAIERVDALGTAGVLGAESGRRLLALADAADQVGRTELRDAALQATRSRFGGTDSAAAAAYQLGRIARYEQKDLSGAASLFRAAHDEGGDHATQQLALGNLLQVLAEAGEGRSARQVASEYLDKYPDGPHATVAEGLAPRRR